MRYIYEQMLKSQNFSYISFILDETDKTIQDRNMHLFDGILPVFDSVAHKF